MERKQLARRIFLRTLDALEVSGSISRCVTCAGQILCVAGREYDLQKFSEFRVIAVGKAAHGMLDGLFALLPPDFHFSGIVSTPTEPEKPRANLRYFLGGHPTPNEQSLDAGRAALALMRDAIEKTLVLVLLSGGGSALMEAPLLESLTLRDIQEMNRALVTCGASIDEINTIRKHVSAVKGGRLAVAAAPAAVITLAVSDVPVGKESALASGPTCPDPTTCADAAAVIKKYSLRDRLPNRLTDWVASGRMPESPKRTDSAFEHTQFQRILGMHELFHTAHRIAEAEDCLAFCDNSTDDWPVEEAADSLLAQLQELRFANPGKPVALIADGELSSAVTGDGVGGRNSAFVLACVEKIAGQGIVVLSAGTDGIDGNSPAAGAVADGETLSRAKSAGLDPQDFFQRSDSFHFFEPLGDSITTGPTGNNLRDMRLLIFFPDA